MIICTPVRKVADTLKQMASSFKAGAVVTDVGSTKREIVEQAQAILPDEIHFIGGHPMAGSEQKGVEAAFPDMFLGAIYVLTPTDDTDLTALGTITAFAESVGARVEALSPEDHDLAAAIISHLPHAIAGALLQTAESAQSTNGSVFPARRRQFSRPYESFGQFAGIVARYLFDQCRLRHPINRRVSNPSDAI